MEQNEKIGYKDIFKQKEYMKMMVAALINRFGDSIDAIASTWIVYELTGSAVWSAVIFGVNKVPSVFVTPLAGAWVEGRNKKVIIDYYGFDQGILRGICCEWIFTWIFAAVDVAGYDVYHIDSGGIQGTSGQRIDTAGIAGRIL